LTADERLIELEIKLTRQDDMLDALNQVVYQQQKKIDHLEALCIELARRIREAADAGGGPRDERPPHY
jgi:SlyX protein